MRVHVLCSSGCSPSGMLLQRWPSSPDCQQKAVSSARFVPRHWTVPGTLGRANWTCVMKLITHVHAHTLTHTHTAVIRSRAAEFITPIYYVLLYQRNAIPPCAFLMLRCHYGPLQGSDRDGGEGVDRCRVRAGCHYPVYRVECVKRFPQNGRGAPTWLRLRGANYSHLAIGTKY